MLPDIKTIIAYAIMAPSGHNTQPWKFKVNGHYIKLTPDYSKTLPVADADDHELFISLGCALENIIIAAKELGYSCNVMYDLNPDKEEILVHVYNDETLEKDPLFDSIPYRHVNRSGYRDDEIPREIMLQLLKECVVEDVSVFTISDVDLKKRVATLLKKAAYIQYQRKDFKQELLQWIRFNEKDALAHKDGLKAASLGSPTVHPEVGRFFVEYFYTPRYESRKAERLANEAPALVLFSVKENSKRNWINLGRSFERFSLKATRYGIAHAHMNMVCEEVEMRNQLKQLLELKVEPLLLLRAGYSDKELPASFRHSVEELVQEGSI